MVAGIAVRRRADRRDRDADRGAVVTRAEDQRLHPRGGGAIASHATSPVASSICASIPIRPDLVPVRQLDLRDQLVRHLDVAGRAHLRHHHRVQPVAGLLDDRDQVLVVVRRVRAVDAHHHGLGAEVGRAQRLDHPVARRVLLVRRDRVLEVEEDLVGLQTDSLGDEALVRAGNGVTGAA